MGKQALKRGLIRVHNIYDFGTSSVKTCLFDIDSEIRLVTSANGVIITPWLHGNRCPLEDSNAGGIFFN